jgi:hypothetical protein
VPGQVTPNLCFCVWWDLRVPYCIPVRPGCETSMHYFSCSGGTNTDSTKCASGQVTSNLCFSGGICGSRNAFRCLRGVKHRHTCRYPEYRVPPHASSKSRRRARRALMRAHVSRGSSSCLPAQGSSRATMCPVAPAPASRLRAAPMPPCVRWLQLPPLGSGQRRGRHVSHGSHSRLPA